MVRHIPVGRRVSVEVPASSANLGPGYDALALALDLQLRVSVEVIETGEHVFEVDGEGADQLRLDSSNRFLSAIWSGLLDAGATWPGSLRISMHNQVPLARGLGSSAAATVAGLICARQLAGVGLGDDRVLALASEAEGHPENAAAALYGGFVVCAAGKVARFEPPAALRAVLFIPDRQLATADMRAVLPESVAHADAVDGVGRAALLVAAFASGDMALLRVMNDDRLHEPYRAAAYPELPILLAAARDAGALGAALSGAGSSVIALCRDDAGAASIAGALGAAARMAELPGVSRTLGLTPVGARVVE